MISCTICKQPLQSTSVYCKQCDVHYKGSFLLPRLARLPSDSQELVEQFLLCGGKLKDLAQNLGVSYPTLRKKVDGIIDQLKKLQQDDMEKQNQILNDIEEGKISSHKGIRIIKEMNGEL